MYAFLFAANDELIDAVMRIYPQYRLAANPDHELRLYLRFFRNTGGKPPPRMTVFTMKHCDLPRSSKSQVLERCPGMDAGNEE
jgi:hypothetical protein